MSKGMNNTFHNFKRENAPITQMIWSVFVFNMELANGRSVFAGLKNQRFWFNSKRLHKNISPSGPNGLGINPQN